MKRQCYDYVLNNRISGFYHPTRENIMGLFWEAQHSRESTKQKVSQYFSKLCGEQGVLHDSSLTNLHYTLVNDCFYFCEYLLGYNVDNELVYNCSDFFINQVSNVKNRARALKFYEELSDVFFELLSRGRIETYSYHVERSIKYIDQKLYSQLTLDDVAERVGLTPQYLTTLFKNETGKNLYQYIKEKKIDEAKMMLLYTGESMTTIANALGFSSSAHFSFAFKQLTGQSPTRFRNERTNMFKGLPD